jgi:pimeloyl-ACP methyl ester carboxylesterase
MAWHGAWCFDQVMSLLAEAKVIGHSYGGAVVTEACVHRSVKQLVYLGAFAPRGGRSRGEG